jgi:mannose-1-phosphate guanylyltransferase/mannose-6-phosphate isomerase
VILSGGSGTRLWPLSTRDLPKQFVPLFDGRSLFDLTLERLDGIEGVGTPIVVTGAPHRALVEEALQSAGMRDRLVLVEPVGRNTAPAALAAALVSGPDDVLVIVPSDHLISDLEGFRDAIGDASRHAGEGGIVTFGIRPSRPETGYGYIEIGEPLDDAAFGVRRFREKPDQATAEEMVDDGRHVWNSGMFVARSDRLIDEARAHCPAILDGVRQAVPHVVGAVAELSGSFASVEAQSIDYAIMEKTDRAVVIPIDVGWDDVGSYRSLLTAVGRDADGNHIDGEVVVDEVNGSFVKATSRRLAVAGLSDVVVVETPEAVLVMPLDRSQDVGDLMRRVEQD